MAREIHDGRGQAPGGGEVATTFPTRYLPPVSHRDMPEPLPLREVLGPGVIAAGIGLASGEFILWPYITSQVGLVFLWAAVLGVVTQFFINVEEHHGAVRPLGRVMYRFLLTVAIALVVWMLLAGLAALLGFL